jgi:hypothetical protein
MNDRSAKQFSRWISVLSGLPWVEILADAWKLGRRFLKRISSEGMYEVLEYESRLELCAPDGKLARLRKRKRVRFLQNDVIAFQDYGWGDGKVLQDYHISPGVPVDEYKIGFKTYILVSLREVKNRGDVLEFHSKWTIRNGFLKSDGFWGTDVGYRSRRMKVQLVFPRDRPPIRVRLEQSNKRRITSLRPESFRRLRDRRTVVTWEKIRPRLFEHYILRWDW